MNAQDRINAFTLAAHRLAVTRLQQDPALIAQALAVLQRWRQQAGGPMHCDPYWDEWERLLQQGPAAVDAATASAPDQEAAA